MGGVYLQSVFTNHTQTKGKQSSIKNCIVIITEFETVPARYLPITTRKIIVIQ